MTNKHFCDVFTAEMYKKDIPTNDAIRHSVYIQKSDEIARKVIRVSVSLGSNVNHFFKFTKCGCTATALHIAAARDRPKVVRELIELGADVNARGSHLKRFLIAMKIFKSDMEDFLMSTESTYFDFLPLFAPCYLQFTVVATQLIDYGADATLLVHPRYDQASVTVFHLYAKNVDLYNKYGRLPMASATVINQVMPRLGSLPLTMAVQHPAENSENLISDFIKHGADVNLTDSIGETPLRLAISCGFFAQQENQRQKYERILNTLIQNGANVNQLAPTREDSTPLLLVVSLLTRDEKPTPTQTKFTTNVIRRLVSHHADINRWSSVSGDTAFNIIFMHSVGKSTKDYSTRLANWFWESGANIHVSSGNSGSLLQRCMRRGNVNAVEYLLQKGARVKSREARSLVYFLFKNHKVRTLGIDALAECQHYITQRAINSLYSTAWKSKSKPDQKWLKDMRLRPSIRFMNELIADCFWDEEIRLAKIDLDATIGFQVNWLHDEGTYMHLVVQRLVTDKSYTEIHALQDGQLLIDAGINLFIKDTKGKTAARYLRHSEVGGRLRLLLWDEMDDQEQNISAKNNENEEVRLSSTDH